MQPLTRSLAEGIEIRVIVGITTFVGIMVLVGWIAINEPGRMAAFERKYEARSIERGAHLFSANCTSCHGENGRGLLGIAPALNSPHFFGYDYLGDINRETDSLNFELESGDISEERVAEINTRLEELNAEREQLIAQMQPAINNGYNPEEPSRLAQVGWGGSQNAYITTTLVHGRPNSGQYWPQAMVSWSQTAGGPLRGDQIQDLANYIQNWNREEWTIDDLNSVVQFAKLPVDAALAAAPAETIGTDVQAIMANLEGVPRDPQEGMSLYTGGAYACAGCHAVEVVAPLTELTWQAVQNERLNDPQFEGYTAEQYLIESIVHPNDYIVPGYNANQMPQNFGERMSIEDLANILAYLESFDS